jgi:diphthamide biosynthesis protein 4
MAYTKNYYHILGLPEPSSRSLSLSSSSTIPTALVRAKYRQALLRAHPDKHTPPTSPPSHSHTTRQEEGAGRESRVGEYGYSVDDVKEAFAILSDERTRREYDIWLRQEPTSTVSRSGSVQGEEDFILGLEVLDLSDFEEVSISTSASTESSPPTTTTTTTPTTSSPSSIELEERVGDGEEEVGRVEWRRKCRCGADGGFRIQEVELEDAAGRGEKEVLVGCVGCSLWVRVGFDVEEG